MPLLNSQHFLALRSNLGIALYLLPSTLRGDALLFYHFCQRLDQCVDDPSSESEKKRLLNQLLNILEEKKSETLAKHSCPLLSLECSEMFGRRNVPRELLCELIRGMQMDLTKNRYASFEELRLYTWRVASTVGLMSAHLFEATGKAVEEYAETLGTALQLTNILRDVAEDAGRNRIYLPREDLEHFGVSEQALLTGKLPPSAKQLFQSQAKRAHDFFEKAAVTWSKLTKLQRRKLRPARLMEVFYRKLLQKINDDEFDLFYHRYRLTLFEKLWLTLAST